MKPRKRRNPTNVLRGKVARLPLALRDELNRRLLDGQTGTEVLDWINAEPVTIERMKALHGGRKISHQNLSEWRKRGYANFLRQRQPAEISRG
jgi:hypothetical protein